MLAYGSEHQKSRACWETANGRQNGRPELARPPHTTPRCATSPAHGQRTGGRKMTVRDELHELVDQLDEDAAREALARLQE